jgi:large subunit ribosomal protein L27
MQLPTPPGAARRRRFGMDAIQRAPEAEESTDPVLHTSQQENEQIPEKRTVVNSVVIRGRTKKEGPRTLKLGSGYMFRESNWEIGRAAERAGVKPVNFKKGDRFLAWQKREQRKKLVADKQGLGRQKKSKAKR